jgi:hypothetical protein
MEAAGTSQMLLNFHQTTQRSISGESHLYTHRLENLKYHLLHSLIQHHQKPLNFEQKDVPQLRALF